MTTGLRYCAVDLHVHTPASRCFRGNVTPEAYVEQAIRAGMAAIAITDHNTGDWVDRIKAAASGTSLTVFPGVEISVQPGIHILAIFPEGRTSAHVNDLLARLHLGADARGEQEALVTEFGAQRVVAMIREEGALPILAHIDDYKGAWRELSGQTRERLWQAAEFVAVEVVGDGLPEGVGRAPYMHVPAYYWSSDNPHPEDHTKHSHLGIGTRCSLFKLDEPITWEGLRLCFHDPAVRIGRAKVETPIHIHGNSHPRLERVRVQGGFLDGLDLVLNPNLNCIIGGRGTGKSTFLELIRYAFDIEPKTGANQRQAQSIIEHTFPAGSQIIVEFRANGTTYRVERSAGRQPQVFRDGAAQPLDVPPHLLLPLEVYGQKEIYEISQDPQFQLRLLDNYVTEEMRPLREEELELIGELKTNATAILRSQETIAKNEEVLSSLGAVQEELRRMAEQDFVTRLKHKSDFDKEKRLLERAQAEVNAVTDVLRSILEEHRPNIQVLGNDVLGDLPHRPLLAQHRQSLERIDDKLTAAIAALIEDIGAIWATAEPDRAAWQTAYEEVDVVFQELLREFQPRGERLSPDRYVELQQREAQLLELQAATEAERQSTERLYEARRQLLARLRDIRRQKYALRCQKAEELTQALGRTVRITIYPQGNRDVYKSFLEELCRGNNVRSSVQQQIVETEADEPEREAQRPVPYRGETRYLVSRIPRYLDPIDLAEAIRTEWHSNDESESVLASRWAISSASMRRNLAQLKEQQLFELETFAVPDLPLIELQVGGGELGYRPLSALSIGQKCTALLGIVLLESSATLLADQPEDDLDNQYIFDQIVNTLRREKERRQFIIATHNANIPVSGDAELIVVVQANENRGWLDEKCVGSIDAEPIKQTVAQILEGGERAFQMRREKYGMV